MDAGLGSMPGSIRQTSSLPRVEGEMSRMSIARVTRAYARARERHAPCRECRDRFLTLSTKKGAAPLGKGRYVENVDTRAYVE